AMTRTMNNPTAIASLVTQDPPLLEGSFTKGESIPSPARGVARSGVSSRLGSLPAHVSGVGWLEVVDLPPRPLLLHGHRVVAQVLIGAFVVLDDRLDLDHEHDGRL